MSLVYITQLGGISMKIAIKSCPICGYGKPKHEFQYIICPRCNIVFEYQAESVNLERQLEESVYKGKYTVVFNILDKKVMDEQE